MAKTLETKGDSLQTIGALQEAIFSYEQSLQCSWSETVNMKKNHLLLNLNTKIKLPETQKIHKPLRIKAPIKKDIPKIDPNNVATDSAAENATSKNIQDIQETSVKKIESTGEDTLKSDLRETNREKPSNEHKKVYRYMPSGTVVNLMLEETVSSESHVAGSRVAFTIQKDITIKGEVVIQKGSKATAKISAAKSLRDYSKAILEIEIQSIQATNGERILLKANTFRIVGKRNEAAQILRGQLFEVRTQTDHTLYFQ